MTMCPSRLHGLRLDAASGRALTSEPITDREGWPIPLGPAPVIVRVSVGCRFHDGHDGAHEAYHGDHGGTVQWRDPPDPAHDVGA